MNAKLKMIYCLRNIHGQNKKICYPRTKKNMLVNNHEMIEYAKIFPYDWFYRDRAKFKIINHIRWSGRFELTSFQWRDINLCRDIYGEKQKKKWYWQNLSNFVKNNKNGILFPNCSDLLWEKIVLVIVKKTFEFES